MSVRPPSLQLPEVPFILGMMRLQDYPELASAGPLAEWIRRRIGQGLCVFDHADIYGETACEQAFGGALRAAPDLRRQVRVITKADIVRAVRDQSPWKVKYYDTSAGYISGAIDAALQRLQVERIDLFLIHRPDPLTPVDELAGALERAVAAGKVRQVGVSNFLPEQWRLLQSALPWPLVCNQIELSLRASAPLLDGRLEAMLRDGLRLLAWSPLARGTLEEGDLGKALAHMSRELNSNPTALALAWLKRLPGSPLPVIGSLREERIEQALAAADCSFTRPMWFWLLEAARGHRCP